MLRLQGARNGGVETRVARRIGLVYAACKLANEEADLLDWPRHLPLRITSTLYRRSRSLRRNGDPQLQAPLAQLRDWLDDPWLVPDVTPRDTIKRRRADDLIGIRYLAHGTTVLGLRQEGLVARLGMDAARVVGWLRHVGLIQTGHGERSGRQLLVTLKIGDAEIAKPRFLALDSQKLDEALSTALTT